MLKDHFKYFIGFKEVHAMPMNRQQYNDLRGWELPSDEDGGDDGYLVEDVRSKPNHPDYEGHLSWSPLEVFESTFRSTDGMTTGLAIEAIKKGHKVDRAGWNGKGMWLMLVPDELADKVAFQYEALSALPWIGVKTADEKFVPWLPSQADMLAEDWKIVG